MPSGSPCAPETSRASVADYPSGPRSLCGVAFSPLPRASCVDLYRVASIGSIS